MMVYNSLIILYKYYLGMYLTTSKLCYSLSGVNTPLLTITDPDESEFPIAKRQYVICTGRVHPGETNSSWMIQV